MKLRHRNVAIALVGLAAVVAAACGSVIEAPDVRVDRVRVGGIGLQGGLLYVDLAVTNPNRFGIEASRLVYNLELAEPGTYDDNAVWTGLAADTLEQNIAIRARDSTTIAVPVRFTYQGLASAIRSLISTDTFDYRIHGDVMLEEPVRRTFPFRHTGTVSGIRTGD